ncbi:hypothetical protein CA234_00065 [Sphingomonas sp. ABOLE]|uniref:DUF6882 domain-containing protein n=1 Tax=Sphingomonas sp. ABOLE TaxID=1985878 RepID=UPI000F7E80A7|nr:DUF6882 domain-containing protein [Sphingomonas sp. ABOLE]RSV45295.1 hypothetical protein CA234_00065 [Sphingomonas sp. ABOLE]
MTLWLGALATLLFGAPVVPDDPRERVHQAKELVFARANAEIALKTEVFQHMVGREAFDWSVDLDEGFIRFTAPSYVASAPVQVIGTYNTRDGTFLWAWDHPSIPESRRADAKLARQFGELQNLSQYTTRKVSCTEGEAWQFTAVASYLAGATGTYRGKSGPTLIYMTFGKLAVSPKKPS